MIRSAIDPRGRAALTSASTLGTGICWGGARSSTSCIRRASGLIRARREQEARSWTEASKPQLALLGPAVADPDALTGLVDDDLPLDDSEEAQLEWEQVQAGVDSNGLSRM